jgi:uncharacterized protein (TIGR02246 family)
MEHAEIETIHKELLSFWNKQDAKGMASLFAEDANVIGFDGSQINGKSDIELEMQKIFKDHETSRYIWKVQEVKFLNNGTALLRAVVGMVPPGKRDIKPDVNAIQSLIATLQSGSWKISLFQNTPARFDGRPELVEKLNSELREVLKSREMQPAQISG